MSKAEVEITTEAAEAKTEIAATVMAAAAIAETSDESQTITRAAEVLTKVN